MKRDRWKRSKREKARKRMKKRQRTVMVVMNDLAVVRERDSRVEGVGERVLLIARENRRVVGHHGVQMLLSCCL